MSMNVIGAAVAYVFGAMMLEIFSDFYMLSKEE
jgi:hypothetical protein